MVQTAIRITDALNVTNFRVLTQSEPDEPHNITEE